MGFRLCKNGALEYMTSDSLGVRNIFTTRRGGYSSGIYESLNLRIRCDDSRDCVRKNFETVCAELGVRPEELVFAKQVHGCEVKTCTRADACGELFCVTPYDADALITRERRVPLIISVADCVPILISDPLVPAIGAAHAGWRGTALDIAGKTVEKMRAEFGCRPENLRAAIGQCIGPCCFETGAEVPEAMRETLGAAAEEFIDAKPNGKFTVDLKGVNRALLIRRGLLPENIDVSDECTRCMSDKYWSHRATKGLRGANSALIMLA